jgi:HEAT repeat protein
MDTHPKPQIAFDLVIKSLLDTSQPFPPVYLHRFSDLSGSDLIQLKKYWSQVIPDRRAAILEDLENLAEADTLVSFDELCRFTLDDSDPRVRQTSLQMLWESNEPAMIPKFIQIMDTDENPLVRAAAASTLGQFIYLGEVEEISKRWLDQVETHLIAVFRSNDNPLVRRRALESLGYSSRKEVEGFIRTAYNEEDNEWLCSALFAMGRSADTAWVPAVLDMLDHPNTDVQFEAVRALGELESPRACGPLLEMLEKGVDDDEVRMAVVWSLSKIGGEKVRDTLEQMLEETDDEDEVELIEEALENLYFTEGFDQFTMFDFDSDDENDLDSYLDQEDDDQDH